MIKQIQLRGISRSPSNRMTSDGGVAESLNLHLDNAEAAPMLMPKDVTASLGLSDMSDVSHIYIHKTANYENIIITRASQIIAQTAAGTRAVLNLGDGETVNEITSIGNSLAISTTRQLYYVLYKDNKYINLGGTIPFPEIEVWSERDLSSSDIIGNPNPPDPVRWTPNSFPLSMEWDSVGNEAIDNFLATMKSLLVGTRNLRPVFVRYAAKLYDGSLLSSPPILCGVGMDNPVELHYQTKRDYTYSHDPDDETSEPILVDITDTNEEHIRYYPYIIYAQLKNQDQMKDWTDIIESVCVYMSEECAPPFSYRRGTLVSKNKTVEEFPSSSLISHEIVTLDAVAQFRTMDNSAYESELIDKSRFTYLVKEIPMASGQDLSQEIKDLSNGVIWESDLIYNTEELYQQELLSGDDMKHYPMNTGKISSFNNQLILVQPNKNITAPQHLNSLCETRLESAGQDKEFLIEITWLLKSFKKNPFGTESLYSYSYSGRQMMDTYGFHVFPDSRCHKMLVKATEITETTKKIRYGTFAMEAHPYLNCAYYYGGLGKTLWDMCEDSSIDEVEFENIEDAENMIYVSEINDPFSFPTEKRYTFQAPIINTGVATKALSQGQFGQFPLYVFTEDGIWVLDTAADGSFLSQKPVSRVVCNNADSITSIDNAIVFTTDRGVMLISGSEVVNISPFMDGEHFVLSGAPLYMIKDTNYAFAIEAMSDTDSFLNFIKDASIAYDYAGQRLILVSKSNSHLQYVYQIQTQTWHKMSMPEVELGSVINSYPECYIKTKPTLHREIILLDKDESERDFFIQWITNVIKGVSQEKAAALFDSRTPIDVTHLGQEEVNDICIDAEVAFSVTRIGQDETNLSSVLDFTTTPYEAGQKVLLGVITTRPFDLDYPDVKKSIKDVRIRGNFHKGAVRYILEGSDDGMDFYALHTLRGRSWKLYRLTLLCNLSANERISYVEVDFDTRFENKLR